MTEYINNNGQKDVLNSTVQMVKNLVCIELNPILTAEDKNRRLLIRGNGYTSECDSSHLSYNITKPSVLFLPIWRKKKFKS